MAFFSHTPCDPRTNFTLLCCSYNSSSSSSDNRASRFSSAYLDLGDFWKPFFNVLWLGSLFSQPLTLAFCLFNIVLSSWSSSKIPVDLKKKLWSFQIDMFFHMTDINAIPCCLNAMPLLVINDYFLWQSVYKFQRFHSISDSFMLEYGHQSKVI